MSKSVYLIKDAVATFEGIDPLNLPARISEHKPRILGLDIDILFGVALKRFHIFVVHQHIFKLESLVIIVNFKQLLGTH